ncbi:MAG: hypothetical protein KF764_28815 [Labilithrix sp.]|nr:hypothetical protein [Labilithrix sp.]MBX3218878.1 hypothetical protein [Labilithrix sp.]
MRRSLPAIRRVAFLLLLVACGSRTGLFVEDDGFTDFDPDAGPDGRRDGGRDAEDLEDAPPPLDVRPPTDVDRTDCPDAEATLVYTITSTYDLQSFNPDTGQFSLIGKIACPTPAPATPFSMAVDRRGIAYVLFNNERLFRVSTATAACLSTSYVPRQSNFGLFGMGFATNSVGPTESLFVAGDDQLRSGRPAGASSLARITPGTFDLTPVGAFSPRIASAELTGTGDGRLFAFYSKERRSPPSYIGEIDTTTAQVVGERRFDNVDQGSGWAFAYWGGDFYMFHAPGDASRVTRWRPSDDSVTQVATTSLKIVGAGVSTCAPQQ